MNKKILAKGFDITENAAAALDNISNASFLNIYKKITGVMVRVKYKISGKRSGNPNLLIVIHH